MRLAWLKELEGLNTLSGGHPLGGDASGALSDPADSVSIPSQAGILLAAISERCRASAQQSQYPLRRASSWRLTAAPIVPDGAVRLNTLSGGHPLGGPRCGVDGRRQPVSIPSQAGILLAVRADRMTGRLPACLNTLSGGHPLGGWRHASWPRLQSLSLNTLSGGHPLGGTCHPYQASWIMCLNTLSGGHPLGGERLANVDRNTTESQYPLRWASSWRAAIGSHGRQGRIVSIPSQVGILLAASSTRGRGRVTGSLNTLSGGHPLGGHVTSRAARPAEVSIPSQRAGQNIRLVSFAAQNASPRPAARRQDGT